jgi:hypothetical protein
MFEMCQATEVSMRNACRSVAVAGLALAAMVTSPASARTVYDGNWSVLIVTKSGPCDAAYRYGLSIRDGQVFYEGSAPVNVRGKVNGVGKVDVTVSAGSQGASGSGRLSRVYGEGEWRGIGSMGACVGTWTAERRRN